MKFLPLLGKQLKNDDVVDVLECADIEVVYDFDRSHENIPDVYWASAKNDGFQFRFDADQILDVIFLYAAPHDDFAPVDRKDCDVLFFTTIEEVEAYGADKKLSTPKGGPVNFLGVRREWVKLEFAEYSVHYEFRAEGLAQVSVTRRKQNEG